MLDTDSDHFDCETCPLADKLGALDAENAEAWAIFGQLYTRLNLDLGLVATVFTRVVQGMEDEDVLTLTDRLAVIYDTVHPVVTPPKTE